MTMLNAHTPLGAHYTALVRDRATEAWYHPIHCMNDPQPEGHMACHIERRKFLATLGGAAAWPLSAGAQQTAMPVIGYLSSRSPEDTTHLLAGFRQGLADGGFIEHQNVTIEYRWALGQYDHLSALATELARLPVLVVAATGGEPAALAAKAATSTIPIVFATGTDPVKAGLVASYNRPGGNATGINFQTADMEAKRLGLLHELMPQAKTIAFVYNPKFAAAEGQLHDVREAARTLGLQINVLHESTDNEINAAFRREPTSSDCSSSTKDHIRM
jgi:putative ABC transport system substrate-binding protein